MHQNNRQHFLLLNFVKNEAESQAVFVVSYVRNVRGRAMLPDSTVSVYFKVGEVIYSVVPIVVYTSETARLIMASKRNEIVHVGGEI